MRNIFSSLTVSTSLSDSLNVTRWGLEGSKPQARYVGVGRGEVFQFELWTLDIYCFAFYLTQEILLL